MSKLVRFAKDELGATAIEYGLIAAGMPMKRIPPNERYSELVGASND